jgi:uncharacterized protein (TIGR02246 family)
MKSTLILFLSSFFFLCGTGQTTKDLAAVKKLVIAFQNDFNEGSFKKAPEYTTRDWEHINPVGGISKGRAAVLEEVRAVHQSLLKGVSMEIETMSVRFVKPDVAIADVVHRLTSYTTPDGVRHEKERQRKTYVVVKQNGK